MIFIKTRRVFFRLDFFPFFQNLHDIKSLLLRARLALMSVKKRSSWCARARSRTARFDARKTRARRARSRLDGSARGRAAAKVLVDELFDALLAGDACVDDKGRAVHLLSTTEVLCGLSVLCETDDRVRAAFELLDPAGSGVVSRRKMELYLRSVFRVLYGLREDVRARLGVKRRDWSRSRDTPEDDL